MAGGVRVGHTCYAGGFLTFYAAPEKQNMDSLVLYHIGNHGFRGEPPETENEGFNGEVGDSPRLAGVFLLSLTSPCRGPPETPSWFSLARGSAGRAGGQGSLHQPPFSCQ